MNLYKKMVVLSLVIFSTLSSSCSNKGKEISREEMENFVKVNFMDASLENIIADIYGTEFHKVTIRESIDNSTNDWVSYKEELFWTKDVIYSFGMDIEGIKNEFYYYTLDDKYYYFDKTNNQKEELSQLMYEVRTSRLFQPRVYLDFMYGDMYYLEENAKFYSKGEGHILAEGTKDNGKTEYIIEIENKHYVKQYSVISEFRKDIATFEYTDINVNIPE